MFNTTSQQVLRRPPSKDMNQADSRFFQSLRPSVADSDTSYCLTNQLLLGVAGKPKTAGYPRTASSQAHLKASTVKLSRQLNSASDIQRLLESRNISVRKVMATVKQQGKDEESARSELQSAGGDGIVRSSSDMKKSRKVVRGLTASAKPTLILSKEIRNNPFAKLNPSNLDSIDRVGLFSMINAGHIPKNINIKKAFNEIRRPQTSNTLSMQSPTMAGSPTSKNVAPAENRSQNTFLTVAIPRSEQIQSPPHSNHKNYRRAIVRMSKVSKPEQNTSQLQSTIRLSPGTKYLTLHNYHILQDDSFWCFRREYLSKGEWSDYLQFEEQVRKFARKYKIRKLEFLPNFNAGLRRVSEQDIIHSLKDSIAIHRILKELQTNSHEFEGYRQVQFRSVMLMIVAKWRFRKTLSQVKYINTIKNLYRIHRKYEEQKCQVIRTLNFKYELFAENQRLFTQQEQESPRRKIVEIHINTIGLNRQERNSYYKFHQRLNQQITRIFSAVRNQDIEVIYISPYCQVSEHLEQYYKRMLKIRAQQDGQLPVVHFFYLENMEGQLGKRVNTEDNLFFGLRPQKLQQLRRIIKNKMAYIVPGQLTRTLIKICYMLDIPCYGGTFTKDSLEVLFNRQYPEDDHSLISHYCEFIRFRPLLSAHTEDELFANLRKQFQEKKEAYLLARKIKQLRFASSTYDRSIVGCRKLFKRMGLPVPLALDTFKPETFYEDLGKMILEHRQRTLWIFKAEGENCSRGIAFLETDSIKVINQFRKKGIVTHEAINEVSNILKIILKEKLRLAHPSLSSSGEYLAKFLQRGGVVEAAVKDISSPCIFGQLQPNGQFHVHGSFRKIEVGSYVNNLAMYPAIELTEAQFKQCLLIASELYKEGYFGFLTIQMLSYIDGQSSKRHRVFEFIGLDCHLTCYSSAQFLVNWLVGGPVRSNVLISDEGTRRSVLYCPLVDNNGFKCLQVRDFFARCHRQNIVYDPHARQGTVLLPLGSNSCQVLSVLCFAPEQRKLYRMMADCLNGLNCMGVKCSQFDKEDNTKNTDNFYILDALWKVREVNRQMSSSLP